MRIIVLCIDVGAFWEKNELFSLLLLNAAVEVEHVVYDLDVLCPVPLDVDVPCHGQDPADPRYSPHSVLQDQLGVMIWARVMETCPEEVPISPKSVNCKSPNSLQINISTLLDDLIPSRHFPPPRGNLR